MTSLVACAAMFDGRRGVRRRHATVWHRVIHSIGALHGIFNDNFKLKVRTHCMLTAAANDRLDVVM